MVALGLIVLSLSKFRRDSLKLSFKGKHISEGKHCLLDDSAAFVMLHNLGKITYLHSTWNSNLSAGRALQSAYELQYGGLARTVLSDKTDLVAFTDVEVDVVQKNETAICDCKTVY